MTTTLPLVQKKTNKKVIMQTLPSILVQIDSLYLTWISFLRYFQEMGRDNTHKIQKKKIQDKLLTQLPARKQGQ